MVPQTQVGVPQSQVGVPQSQVGGTPVPGGVPQYMVLPSLDRTGYLTVRTGVEYPSPRTGYAWAGYTTGVMPLAVSSRRIVLFCIQILHFNCKTNEIDVESSSGPEKEHKVSEGNFCLK